MTNLTTKKRWTQKEEDFVLQQLKIYKSVAELPLVSMSKKMDRTPDSIRKKAGRLYETKKSEYVWDSEASKDAFMLYLQELSLATIIEKLKAEYEGIPPTLDDLEQKLKELREAWSNHIRSYAEERGLVTAKHFKLETIRFYIENRLTDKDFVRKVLHGKIRNG